MKIHLKILGLSLILLFSGIFSKANTGGFCESGYGKPRFHAEDLQSGDYDVLFYKIDLTVSDTNVYLKGSATVNIRLLSVNVGAIDLDFSDNYQIDSVLVNNSPSTYLMLNDVFRVFFPGNGQAGQDYSISVFYHGYGYDVSESATGIYNRSSYVNHKRYTYTLSEPLSAKYWFPCKQDLYDKADSVYVNITTGSNLKAGSNGLLTKTVQLPGGLTRYEWKSRYPIAYYLISFSVGDFIDYSFYVQLDDKGDSMLVQNYVYNDSVFFIENKKDIDTTARLIKLFSDLFGPYPFASEKYGHCLVPLGGGMEHQTMTTLGNFSFLLIAHELSHQWYGDNVTCSSWQDIWINEGFASYAEYLAKEYLDSKNAADLWMEDAGNYVKTAVSGSIFVPDKYAQDENRIFDYRLSYKKGAAIIHMIRQEIGNDEMFFRFLKDIQVEFNDNVASVDDIRRLLESETGKSFDRFFQQWYYGEGYPKIKIYWFKQNDTLVIRSLQEATAESPSVFDIKMQLLINFYDNPDSIIEFRQDSNFKEVKFYMPGNIRHLQFDPYHWLLADLDGIFNISDNISPGSKFLFSPNPVNEKINIQFRKAPSTYKIYIIDLNGKITDIVEGEEKYFEMDVRHLIPGSYILLIEEDNSLFPVRFIKL